MYQFGPLKIRHQDGNIYIHICNFTGNACEGKGSFQTMMLIRNLCKERGKEGLGRESLRPQCSLRRFGHTNI